MDPQSLADAVGDRRPRVEARVRVLEDDLHPPPVALEVGALDPGDVLAVEADRARGGVDEAQQQPPDRRLAAAGLADEPERLAAADVEAHVVDGLDLGDRPLQDPALHREMLDEVAHLDEGCRVRARARHAPTSGGLRRGDGGGGCRGRPGPQRARLIVVDPAAHVVAGANRQQGRVLVERVVDALLDPGQAARGEAAARGQVDQVRHVAGDDRQLLAEVADDRDRPDEAAGIRMERLAEERHDVGLLDDLAGVHHRDAIAHLGDDAEVVGDQDDRRCRSRRAGCA